MKLRKKTTHRLLDSRETSSSRSRFVPRVSLPQRTQRPIESISPLTVKIIGDWEARFTTSESCRIPKEVPAAHPTTSLDGYGVFSGDRRGTRFFNPIRGTDLSASELFDCMGPVGARPVDRPGVHSTRQTGRERIDHGKARGCPRILRRPLSRVTPVATRSITPGVGSGTRANAIPMGEVTWAKTFFPPFRRVETPHYRAPTPHTNCHPGRTPTRAPPESPCRRVWVWVALCSGDQTERRLRKHGH